MLVDFAIIAAYFVGILAAVLFFVPFLLRQQVTTITQFFESKLGPQVALMYLPAWYRHGFRLPDQHFLELSDRYIGHFAWGLLASLVLCPVILR